MILFSDKGNVISILVSDSENVILISVPDYFKVEATECQINDNCLDIREKLNSKEGSHNNYHFAPKSESTRSIYISCKTLLIVVRKIKFKL